MTLALPLDHRPRVWLRRAGVAAFVPVLGVIVYATAAPIRLRPKLGFLHGERVLAFVALGAALSLAQPRRLARSAAIMTGIACGMEAIQSVVPTRDERWPDAVEKHLAESSASGSEELCG